MNLPFRRLPMDFAVIATIVIVLLALAIHNARKIDPAEQQAAEDIGNLIRSNRTAGPAEVAQVFVKHRIPRARGPEVGRMVMPQLQKTGMNSDDAREAMITVRESYSLVPESYSP